MFFCVIWCKFVDAGAGGHGRWFACVTGNEDGFVRDEARWSGFVANEPPPLGLFEASRPTWVTKPDSELATKPTIGLRQTSISSQARRRASILSKQGMFFLCDLV